MSSNYGIQEEVASPRRHGFLIFLSTGHWITAAMDGNKLKMIHFNKERYTRFTSKYLFSGPRGFQHASSGAGHGVVSITEWLAAPSREIRQWRRMSSWALIILMWAKKEDFRSIHLCFVERKRKKYKDHSQQMLRRTSLSYNRVTQEPLTAIKPASVNNKSGLSVLRCYISCFFLHAISFFPHGFWRTTPKESRRSSRTARR